jgi:hypothetical protein
LSNSEKAVLRRFQSGSPQFVLEEFVPFHHRTGIVTVAVVGAAARVNVGRDVEWRNELFVDVFGFNEFLSLLSTNVSKKIKKKYIREFS